MKTLNEYNTLLEAQDKNDNDVYVVYFNDGTMFNFFYEPEQADIMVKKLNEEVPSNKAYVKQEKLSKIIKESKKKDN